MYYIMDYTTNYTVNYTIIDCNFNVEYFMVKIKFKIIMVWYFIKIANIINFIAFMNYYF